MMLTCNILFSCFVFLSLQNFHSGFVICFECNRTTDHCCQNYYIFKVNGYCTECPPGTFGLNCSGTCGQNYYGRLCKEQCNCTDNQYCHPVQGCLHSGSNTTKAESVVKESIAVQENARSLECKSDTVQCCPNYYKVNGNCTECPVGTFGLNCTSTCPEKYYGLFCMEQCNCSDSQYCDSINGCVHNKRNTKERETVAQNTHADTHVWEKMTFAFSGSIVTALAVAVIMCLRSRLKTNRNHQSIRCPGEDQADMSGAGQNNGDANIENIDFLQGCSRGEILDTFHVNVSKETNSKTSSMENEITNGSHSDPNNGCFIEKLLMYTNPNEETNTEDKSIPNYDVFQMPSQYSILSLKRNINPSAVELYAQTKYSNADVYDLSMCLKTVEVVVQVRLNQSRMQIKLCLKRKTRKLNGKSVTHK